MNHSNHFDPFRKNDVVNDMMKFPESNRPNGLPDLGIHFRHRFNSIEDFLESIKEFVSKAGNLCFKFSLNLENVLVGQGPQNNWETHDRLDRRAASASRQ